MFAQDYSGSSGNLQTDTNAVTCYLQLHRTKLWLMLKKHQIEAEEKL